MERGCHFEAPFMYDPTLVLYYGRHVSSVPPPYGISLVHIGRDARAHPVRPHARQRGPVPAAVAGYFAVTLSRQLLRSPSLRPAAGRNFLRAAALAWRGRGLRREVRVGRYRTRRCRLRIDVPSLVSQPLLTPHSWFGDAEGLGTPRSTAANTLSPRSFDQGFISQASHADLRVCNPVWHENPVHAKVSRRSRAKHISSELRGTGPNLHLATGYALHSLKPVACSMYPRCAEWAQPLCKPLQVVTGRFPTRIAPTYAGFWAVRTRSR